MVPVWGPANHPWRGSKYGGQLWARGPRGGNGAVNCEPSRWSWAFLSSCSGWRSPGRRYLAAQVEQWLVEGVLCSSNTKKDVLHLFCWKLCSSFFGMHADFKLAYLHTETSGLAACVGGSRLPQNSRWGRLDCAECRSQPTVAHLPRTTKSNFNETRLHSTRKKQLKTLLMILYFPKTPVPGLFPRSRAVKLRSRFCCLEGKKGIS